MLKPKDYLFAAIPPSECLLYKNTLTNINSHHFQLSCNLPNDPRETEFLKIKDNNYLCSVLEALSGIYGESFSLCDFVKKHPLFSTDTTSETIRENLKVLYAVYLCHLLLNWDASVDEPGFCEYIQQSVSHDATADFKMLCKDFLHMVSLFEYGTGKISIVLDKNGEFAESLHFNSAFHMLVYHLYRYIMAGDLSKEGKSVHNCEVCGKEFIRESKKKHLCDFCGSASQRTRLCRERKAKEALSNAEKK